MDMDSQNSRHDYSTFYVTARGTQAETHRGRHGGQHLLGRRLEGGHQPDQGRLDGEMSIPFALLRYPRGATAFGMDFYRYLARETTYQNWPYLPPRTAATGEAPYIHEFTGIHPPFFAPRPIFLPYTLITGGAGNSAAAWGWTSSTR